MKNKKKSVLILGGSSDIGVEVVKIFLQLEWICNVNVEQHFLTPKNIFVRGKIDVPPSSVNRFQTFLMFWKHVISARSTRYSEFRTTS